MRSRYHIWYVWWLPELPHCSDVHTQLLCRYLFLVKPLTIPLDTLTSFPTSSRQASAAKARELLFSRRRYLILSPAFTELQIGRLSDLVDTNPERTVASSVNTSNCDLRSSPATSSSSNRRSVSGSSIPVKRRVSHGASSSRGLTPDITNFDDIAREFGVGPDLVEALAQRLSGMY